MERDNEGLFMEDAVNFIDGFQDETRLSTAVILARLRHPRQDCQLRLGLHNMADQYGLTDEQRTGCMVALEVFFAGAIMPTDEEDDDGDDEWTLAEIYPCD